MYNMPGKYQSQKKSQSKNGGRGRKKRTMRKLRRGRKSRKVMSGGGDQNLKPSQPMSKN